MLKILVFIMLLLATSSLFAEFRYDVEDITDPYTQGWSREKVTEEDSINLHSVSNIRVNKVGYISDGPSKIAMVMNHSVGDDFKLIDVNTNSAVYSGKLKAATDINGNIVSSVDDADWTIAFYRITTKMNDGYPKVGTIKNGPVAIADFTQFTQDGHYRVECGSDVSETFEISKYVLNKAASIQAMFMGFQRCGSGSWAHGTCHAKDGDDLGPEYEGAMAGAWHDCGDHIKVGSNIGFTTSMLAFMSVVGKGKLMDVFNADYTDTILTDGVPDHLREAYQGIRYMVNAYNLSVKTGKWDNTANSGEIYTGVGSTKDHEFWDLPTRQEALPASKGGAPRPLHLNGTDGLDVLGGWAASLAWFASAWKDYDKDFADSCYNIAKSIYEFGYKNHDAKPKWNFEGLYFSDGWQMDEMTFAAIALAYASKELGDKTSSSKYMNDIFLNTTLGQFNSGDISWNPYYLPAGWLASKKGVFVSGMATVDWQNYWEVDLYAILKLILTDEATVKSFGNGDMTTKTLDGKPYWESIRNRICNTFAGEIDKADAATGIQHKDQFFDKTIKDKISYAPFNIPKSAYSWGFNRYMMGRTIIPFMFAEFLKDHLSENWTIPYTKYADYYKWGIGVVNYLCGVNPWDISMIVGLGKKFPHHLHNRTACAENSNTGSPPYNFIPPYGALAPWTHPSAMIEDISEKGLAGQGYMVTETCVDYSIATMFAMVMASGDIPKDEEPPIVSDVNYVQVDNSTYYFTWSTNELSNDTLFWAETSDPTIAKLNKVAIPQKSPDDVMGMQKEHELFISGLSQNKTYYFYIKSVDRFGNIAYETNKVKDVNLFYKFVLTSIPNAKIENLLICPKDEHTVMIAWWTDVATTSNVVYWKTADPTDKTTIPRDDKSTITKFHQVTLQTLDPATEYTFTAKSGNDSKDSTFKTDFAFAKVRMTSAMTSGANPEVSIFLDNFDLQYNQAYDGLIFRFYLDYPADKFNQINGHIGVSDATLYDPEAGGVSNVVAKVVNNADIPYKNDGFGNYYAEIKLPKGDGTKLKSGGWMYFRMQLWGCNSNDAEMKNSWSIEPHATPVVQDYPPVLPSINGNVNYLFGKEDYVGLFQEDENGDQVHLFGFLPTTDADNPDFHQNYTMNLSLSKPVQSPPIKNFTVESDDEVRYLELKGHAESIGDRYGHGSIGKLMINDKELPIAQPNNGDIDFSYNYALLDGSNVINVIALDQKNCAFNNLALTVLSKEGAATPANLTVYRVTKTGMTTTDVAEINKDLLYFKVLDLDENKSETSREEEFVTIINPAINDTEVVKLKETDKNNGEFSSLANGSNIGIRVTETGVSGDGVINGSSGDLLQVIYQDPNSSHDRQVANITIYSDKSGVKFADSLMVPLSNTFNYKPRKDSVYVRLIDYNNQSGNSLPITIESMATGDKISVTTTKYDADATIKVFKYGPLPLVFSSSEDNANNLYAGLNDQIIVTYFDANDPSDVSRDTLVISASYKKIFISWSPLDTSMVAKNDTTLYTTNQKFALYALGVKRDGTIEKVAVKWTLNNLSGTPFKFYNSDLNSDTMLVVTLSGESEGKGTIDASFELDPSLKIESTGEISIVDPIDEIYVIPTDSVLNGLTVKDTAYALNKTSVYDYYLGIQNKYSLVGIVRKENKLYKIGGFWTIIRGDGSEYIIDTTYSGSQPPLVDINALDLLGKNSLKIVYNTKKGLVNNYNVNILDPVDLITVYSPLFYKNSNFYINNSNYQGDTLKADYNIYQRGDFNTYWIHKGELSFDTLDIKVNWKIKNLITNKVINVDLNNIAGVKFNPGELFLITVTRGDSTKFSFYFQSVDMMQLGFMPNPLPYNLLKSNMGRLKYTTDKDVYKVNVSIFDAYGNVVKKYKSWENNILINNNAGDFNVTEVKKKFGAVTKNYKEFVSKDNTWDGTNLYKNIIQSGVYNIVVEAYDKDGKLIEASAKPFYFISK